MKNYLEFEKDIKTLEDEMELLKSPGNESISEVDTSKIKSTQDQINSKLKSIYSSLNSWQKTQVARHEDRPRASFYIRKIFNNFTPLAGDRYFGDDRSITTGKPANQRNVFSAIHVLRLANPPSVLRPVLVVFAT